MIALATGRWKKNKDAPNDDDNDGDAAGGGATEIIAQPRLGERSNFPNNFRLYGGENLASCDGGAAELSCRSA